MKKTLLLLCCLFLTVAAYSQKIVADGMESASPTYGVTMDRKVKHAVIEGVEHEDVIVVINAADYKDRQRGVKVTVRDLYGRTIYSKRFKRSLLYAFTDGQILVGKGNALSQLIMSKKSDADGWSVKIREMGLY